MAVGARGQRVEEEERWVTGRRAVEFDSRVGTAGAASMRAGAVLSLGR